MSRIPGSSPITPDIETIRHSEDEGFFGDGNDGGSTSETEHDEEESEDEGARGNADK